MCPANEFYVHTLDADGIRLAALQTHPLWGQGRSFEAYHARIAEAFHRLGSRMRYVGLFDPRGDLVASCRLLDLALQWNGEVEPVTGIAAVFVPPEHRGAGHAHRLLEIVLRSAASQGAVAALLYSDIAPQFYRRLGFVDFPAVDWDADTAALPPARPYAVRAALPEDVPKLLHWYSRDAEHLSLCPARTEPIWRFFRWWRGVANDCILLENGREVGYVTVTTDVRGMRVWEWAAPEADPERVWATIKRTALSLDLSYVCGWLRPDRQEPWMTTHARVAAIPMVKPLLPGAALPPPDAAGFEELDHF